MWRVHRQSEAARFAEHSKLDNRKLLWHGTHIAVVADMLRAGVRIMPHAGGRWAGDCTLPVSIATALATCAVEKGPGWHRGECTPALQTLDALSDAAVHRAIPVFSNVSSGQNGQLLQCALS